MNRNLKNAIKDTYSIPKPTRKDEFLKTLDYPKTNFKSFFIYQISYIRKRVFVISTTIMFGILLFLYSSNICNNNLKTIWVISSALPFIALLSFIEISRSASYNMVELEKSCKYNLSDILLSKMCILGIFNFMLFSLLIITVQDKTTYNMFRLILYVFAPFLLTCMLSLITLNFIKSKDSTYICGVISCFVSIINSIIINLYQVAYEDKYVYLWFIMCLSFLVAIIFLINIFVKKTEELNWNLKLMS